MVASNKQTNTHTNKQTNLLGWCYRKQGNWEGWQMQCDTFNLSCIGNKQKSKHYASTNFKRTTVWQNGPKTSADYACMKSGFDSDVIICYFYTKDEWPYSHVWYHNNSKRISYILCNSHRNTNNFTRDTARFQCKVTVGTPYITNFLIFVKLFTV